MSKNLSEIIFEGINPERIEQIERMCTQVKLAIGLVERLRGPQGCPWDREQNHLTLRPYLIEEAYEVLDVLDRYVSKADPKKLAAATAKSEYVPADGSLSAADQKALREELGDLLLQVLLHSQLCNERGEFHFGDVSETMAAKLVSRHPHVFQDQQVSGAEQVLQNWETLKKKEGKKSLLEGLPKNLPSLQRAARIGEKVHRVGFDWKDWQGSWSKVEEELKELREAIDQKGPVEQEHELGDLFFALCNLSRHLKLQPEDAHRKAIHRFESRFTRVEEICREEGIDMQTASLERLDEIWDRVKREMAKAK